MRLFCLPLCLAAAPCFGQDAGAIVPQPALGEYVAAFPRVAGDGAASKAINARLALLDEGAAELSECDLTRDVKVMLDSAAFISLYGNEGGYCEGAAHPFFAEYGLTFDRATGQEVDWKTLLPEALLQTKAETYDENYPFASPALNTAYLASIDPVLAESDCKEVYDMGLSFDFWLLAKAGVAMVPSNLPYAATACAEIGFIPLQTLQELGADARLLTAIETGTAP